MKGPEPYFRSFDGWWYVQIRVGGKRRQIKLAKGEDNREAAYQKWHKVMADPPRPAQRVVGDSVKVLLDQFIDHCKTELSQTTADWYTYFIQSFADSIDNSLTADEVKVSHVTDWLKGHTWSKSTKSGGIQAVRRAFRWLSDEGRIRGYPLKTLKGTRKKSRETVISPDTFDAIIKNSRPQFRDLLRFLLATGARPQEARHVEARHVDLACSRIVFPASESKGKEHPRVIYLNDDALEIVTRLLKKFPAGRLFRNGQGKPWTRNAIRCRFRRLREKVGSFCAYHLRHTYATDALKKLDPITVSVLLGHSDPTTLARTYQHLAKDPVHMLEVAKKAR